MVKQYMFWALLMGILSLAGCGAGKMASDSSLEDGGCSRTGCPVGRFCDLRTGECVYVR